MSLRTLRSPFYWRDFPSPISAPDFERFSPSPRTVPTEPNRVPTQSMYVARVGITRPGGGVYDEVAAAATQTTATPTCCFLDAGFWQSRSKKRKRTKIPKTRKQQAHLSRKIGIVWFDRVRRVAQQDKAGCCAATMASLLWEQRERERTEHQPARGESRASCCWRARWRSDRCGSRSHGEDGRATK